MATKYVIHGAAFDGDGTASNVAASAGAAGAWNDIEDVLSNTLTYGSYAAGDTIYVATNDGTSDLSFTRSGSWTWNAPGDADDGNYVTLIFDDGTNVGSAGTFTFNATGIFTIEGWEIIGNDRLVFNHTSVSGVGDFLRFVGYAENFVVTMASTRIITSSQYRGAHLRGVTVNYDGVGSEESAIFSSPRGGELRFDDLVVDFTNVNLATVTPVLFSVNKEQGTTVRVNGLDITGTGTDEFSLFMKDYDHTSNTSRVQGNVIDGLSCSSSITTDNLVKEPMDEVLFHLDSPCIVRGGENPYNAIVSYACGYVAWTKGKNYPYLNATLPDGTGWSYLIKPTYAKVQKPLQCPPVRKLWESTASTVTVKLELAVDDRQTPKDSEVWVNVCYINNSNNKMVTESTRVLVQSEATLTTSTATWNPNPPVYGSISLDEYKLELTTANSVKQYTEVVVHLFVGLQAFDSNSFWFYCPDVVLT